MRVLLWLAVLFGSGIAWIEPFGPWAPTSLPPAARSAPRSALLNGDTLQLRASAWRDYMPMVTSTPCGGERGHDLRLVVWVGRGNARVALAVDSLWLGHRTRTLVDRAPRWERPAESPEIDYAAMPEWAVGDSFTVAIAARGLDGGQRYLAVPVRVMATY